MIQFKPYYLFFLDRELLDTLGLYNKLPLTSIRHDLIMSLLSTPCISYCSMSLVFESDYANSLYFSLLPLFQAGDIVLNMSGAKSLYSWKLEKESQYKHADKQVYHRYFNNDWEIIAKPSPVIHWRDIDTTSDLSEELSEYIDKANYSELIAKDNDLYLANEIRQTGPYIIDAILHKGEKAITKYLFKDVYKYRGVHSNTVNFYNLSISLKYVASQLKEFNATIPINGKAPIHEFDHLSTNSPLNNLYLWEMIYRKLGIFEEAFNLTGSDLYVFRSSDVFEPLLDRIKSFIQTIPTHKNLLKLYHIRKYAESDITNPLARLLDKARKIINTDWPLDKPFSPRKKIMETAPNPKKVFVIHGRNLIARDAIFSVLEALRLEPLEWSEAIGLTDSPSPYIGDILEISLQKAQALVVLMTGDDEAKLLDCYIGENDESYEKTFTPQPRPNVIFEAGMALGKYPARTILISYGKLRPFSDIQGRHVLYWNDSPEVRHRFAERLKKAGCEVNTSGERWLTAGAAI